MTNKSHQKKPPSAFYLEAQRGVYGMSILISGVIGIQDFCITNVELLTHGGRILVKGDLLNINVYDGGCVQIEGIVEDLAFNYGKN